MQIKSESELFRKQSIYELSNARKQQNTEI